MKITLPDNSSIDLETGSSAVDAAKTIGNRLYKDAVAAKINDKLVDLNTKLKDGDKLEVITLSQPEGLNILRHSAAHVMAEAVKKLFPEAKLGIGPTIEEGFYYDFDLPRTLNQEDLPAIEEQMRKIIASNQPFRRREVSAAEAKDLFNKTKQKYKVELINELEEEKVTLYEQDGFVDLCRGPHLPSTGKITNFKLLKTAGAYWHGDEHQPMLQRIYGTAFAKASQLKEYLEKIREAEQRDHRRLGQQLDLFHIDPEVGPGLPLWHPKGALIRKVIEDFWRDEHLKHGYQMVIIPHIARLQLWKISGHWDFYREYMYSPMAIDDQEYVVKPMNCPGHIKIYKSKPRSYRDMPIRWAELGTVYRYERSGVLHGLLRVRGFTQDDAHIFCRPDQLEEEIAGVLSFVLYILGTFGFKEYEIYVSTRPAKYVGSLENWQKATSALEKALDRANLPYEIDPGEGVFYGPKIDIKIKDALGRAWQCTTIQVDFNLPQRFDVTYKGEDNQDHRPIMIHRALLGSLERFIGCLIEHYAGAFPLWLSPVQVLVIPIADRHTNYAQGLVKQLSQAGIRTRIDDRSETTNRKIRDGQMQKIPYMLVVGDREVANGTASVRLRSGQNLGAKKLSEIFEVLKRENREKSISSYF
jgi:threonyl-tRNA synthetase